MMSNIPKNRKDLNRLISEHFSKLLIELEDISSKEAKKICSDDFTIKDILAIRLWWTKSVMKWVKEGKKGKVFELPAPGFTWRETPALNQQIASEAKSVSYEEVKKKLISEQKKLLKLVESLTDRELTKIGVFEWAGKWPVMRWLSIGTSSQYDGARKLIRKAKKSF